MRAYSRTFDPNGLGYLDRADAVNWWLDSSWRLAHPTGALRSGALITYAFTTANTEGVITDVGAGAELDMESRQQWTISVGGNGEPTHYDDRETRGGIPFQIPPQINLYANMASDRRKPFHFNLNFSAYNQGAGYRDDGRISFEWLPAPNFSILGIFALHLVTDMTRYVTTNTDPTGEQHYIFGQQSARIFDSTLRMGLAINRRLTLDFYSQLLYGQVHFERYSELINPSTLVPTQLGTDPSRDSLSLTMNLILRYEYQPGAFLSLVALHRQQVGAGVADPGYGTGLGMLGIAPPDTQILGKLTYVIF
jgi:hypothetical protein